MADTNKRILRIKSVNGDTRFQKERLYIKQNLFLYLLFYIDEDHKGRYMISEAAQTRQQNIKRYDWIDNVTYRVHCIPIQSVDEIVTQISEIRTKNADKNVLIAEMGVFSHAGVDGPISYNKNIALYFIDSSWPHQMSLNGWKAINVKWATQARCVFYGCNTGNLSKSFAENISKLPNFKEVEVWGQSTSSFPSFYPDYRVTSIARSIGDNGTGWDIRGKTYQVAGNQGEGEKALSYRPDKDTLSPAELNEGGYPKANIMICYKNGELITSSHQGVFNDHR